MKKILSLFLIISLFLIPTFSYAYDYYEDDEYYYEDDYYEGEEMPMSAVLFMEAFVTMHMSAFVLMPMAYLVEKENPQKMFWFFFIARIVLLLYFDFYVSKMVCIVDFFAVFVGAFIIVPITGVIQGAKNNIEAKKIRKEDYTVKVYKGRKMDGDDLDIKQYK